MKQSYWDRRNHLDTLYLDTLRNMAARLGCNTIRKMNKAQVTDFIIRSEKNVNDTNYIDNCIAEGRDGTGKFLYLGN